jgi:hypothetical protein
MTSRRRFLSSVAAAAAFLIGFTSLPAPAQPGPTQAELNAAASNAADWLLTNHDYGGQRFVDRREHLGDADAIIALGHGACHLPTGAPLTARLAE